MCPPSRMFCGSEYPPPASSSTRLTWITSSSGRGVMCSFCCCQPAKRVGGGSFICTFFHTLKDWAGNRSQHSRQETVNSPASSHFPGKSKVFCLWKMLWRIRFHFFLPPYLLLSFTLFSLPLFGADSKSGANHRNLEPANTTQHV